MNDARRTGSTLFLAMFAAQSGVIALSPVLASVAADFGVSTAAAGQLRTASGLAAGLTALAVPALANRHPLRRLMLCGALLLTAGSLAAAAAPSLAVLALAQIAIGVAVALLTASATTAAFAWSPESRRTMVLARTLVGQPTAWIVGMPLIGLLGEASWRYGWLALPFAASVAVTLALARRRGAEAPSRARFRDAFAEPTTRRWALAELLTNCGWTGTLVYAGALFADSYDTPATLTGLLLAAGAAAYVAGNIALRRASGRVARRHLVALSLLLAVAVPAFGIVRPGVAASAALFAVTAFVAGGRVLVGSAFGLAAAPKQRIVAMGVRAATLQFGYFIGSAAAGAALGAGGYSALGLTLGSFFAAGAVVLVARSPGRRPALRARSSHSPGTPASA